MKATTKTQMTNENANKFVDVCLTARSVGEIAESMGWGSGPDARARVGVWRNRLKKLGVPLPELPRGRRVLLTKGVLSELAQKARGHGQNSQSDSNSSTPPLVSDES